MIANFHTHTKWCRHGEGEIEDFILEAISCGLKELAITEHVPHKSNYDSLRMLWEEFPAYNDELDRMIEKYRSKILVRKGFECEYIPGDMPSYRRFREKYGYGIMILGQHTSQDTKIDYFAPKGEDIFRQYAEDVLEGLSSGFFSFLAHPDVALCGYYGRMEYALGQIARIFRYCEKHHVPVEINANGLRHGRPYPDRRVWEMSRDFDLIYLIGSDAHRVPYLCDEAGVLAAEQLAADLGIKITEEIPRSSTPSSQTPDPCT